MDICDLTSSPLVNDSGSKKISSLISARRFSLQAVYMLIRYIAPDLKLQSAYRCPNLEIVSVMHIYDEIYWHRSRERDFSRTYCDLSPYKSPPRFSLVIANPSWWGISISVARLFNQQNKPIIRRPTNIQVTSAPRNNHPSVTNISTHPLKSKSLGHTYLILQQSKAINPAQVIAALI